MVHLSHCLSHSKLVSDCNAKSSHLQEGLVKSLHRVLTGKRKSVQISW